MEISFPLILRIADSLSFSKSVPSNRTSPETISPGGDGIRRIMERAVTLLPQPDSPTSPRVSPCRTSRSSPSTAAAVPSSVVKVVLRSLILRSWLVMTNTGLPPNWQHLWHLVGARHAVPLRGDY